MRELPSRLRRLDDALAGLPLDEPMLLTELDGFLTGILLCRDPIAPAEWLPILWGGEESGAAPFDDPADVRWFTDAVMARYNEIERGLDRGKPQPIFDVDRDGEILWELWIEGFAEAMMLRPESWAAAIDGDDEAAATAATSLALLIAVARNESELDSQEINALHDRAPVGIVECIMTLHMWRRGGGAPSAGSPLTRPAKVGRNEPCPCGSGKKFKRCCG